MGYIDKFNEEKEYRIKELSGNLSLKEMTSVFIIKTGIYKYSYDFASVGHPIFQYNQDMIAMQEIIW